MMGFDKKLALFAVFGLIVGFTTGSWFERAIRGLTQTPAYAIVQGLPAAAHNPHVRDSGGERRRQERRTQDRRLVEEEKVRAVR